MGFKIPALNVQGLGLSELKPDSNDLKVVEDLPVPKKAPFVPKLAV